MTKTKKFGIGEWYGRLFKNLSIKERNELAVLAQKTVKAAQEKCPFRSLPNHPFYCNKKGGVCSLILYEKNEHDEVFIPSGTNLVTTCPNRFYQDGLIFQEIGSELLNHKNPIILNEFSFLMENPGNKENDRETVGKIDTILLSENKGEIIEWCALEMQAVYFSGEGMQKDFKLLTMERSGLPFPIGQRRPDFRSSGPKRLMPQLQIKVPTLRRWGKKMAVVVDEEFFNSLGSMNQANHVSNADIIWFVIDYDISRSPVELRISRRCYTTLEHAVEGLTGGVPIPLPDFEHQIKKKLAKVKKLQTQ
jgi:hypothetical protein